MQEEREQAVIYTFSGRVQGVGFRQCALRLASTCTVGGYVKNLHDGSVVLHVEGKPSELVRFVELLTTAMADNITSTRWETVAVQGIAEFSIRQ